MEYIIILQDIKNKLNGIIIINSIFNGKNYLIGIKCISFWIKHRVKRQISTNFLIFLCYNKHKKPYFVSLAASPLRDSHGCDIVDFAAP